MESRNEKIHDFLINKSKKFPFIKNEIRNNGVLKITKQSIDLFSFMVKTIIAQQISNEVAEILWKRLCSQLEKKSISIKSFKNIKYLQKILIKTKISKSKIIYISELYTAILKKEIDDYTLLKKTEDEINSLLMGYKGVGQWTCNMILIFFYKKLNIFPENDLVIKKTLRKLNLLEKKKLIFKKIMLLIFQFSLFICGRCLRGFCKNSLKKSTSLCFSNLLFDQIICPNALQF